MLKRVLPFSITLMIGALLGGLMSPGHVYLKSSATDRLSRQHDKHSKTWVVIHSLGGNPCRKVNVYHTGTNGYNSENRPIEVHVLLGADGGVSKVYPSEAYLDGSTDLDRSTDDALDAAEQIRFTPATRDGVPISVWLDVTYCGENPGHAKTAKTLDGEDWQVIDE